MSALWEPLEVCAIGNPLERVLCIGKARQGKCGSTVSREARQKAHHKLEILGHVATDVVDIEVRLQEIAGLLLCKRWHQSQRHTIARLWYEAIQISPVPQIRGSTLHTRTVSSSSHSRRGESEIPSIIDGPSPAWPRRTAARAVSIETLERNTVPFMVSTTRLAAVQVGIEDGQPVQFLLRSFRSRFLAPPGCSICQDDSATEKVVVTCEECSCDFHLSCMQAWLTARSHTARYTCPLCRKERVFDGIYCEYRESLPSVAPVAGPTITDARPSTTTTTTTLQGQPPEPLYPPLEQPRSGSNTRRPFGGVRRSGRVRQPPDFYTPS